MTSAIETLESALSAYREAAVACGDLNSEIRSPGVWTFIDNPPPVSPLDAVRRDLAMMAWVRFTVADRPIRFTDLSNA